MFMKKSINLVSFILCVLMLLISSAAWSIEAPGNILYQTDGTLYVIQPDGRGEKKLADNVESQSLFSPDGTRVAYSTNKGVFVETIADGSGKQIHSGSADEVYNVIAWLGASSNDLFFRRVTKTGFPTYFKADLDKGAVTELGSFFESPWILPKNKLWLYSNYQPGSEKSEVFCGEIGGESRYVYTGMLAHVLAWESTGNLIYSFNDKIYGYEYASRERQIINLPFKRITVVAYCYPSILYYKLDDEKQTEGLHLFDPEQGDEKTVVENKRTFLLVTMNAAHDKVVVFSPKTLNNPMGEGELFLVDVKKGESLKLTSDTGKRVFTQINMNNQWSPDGKHFVYEKMRLKYSNLKKGDIFITTAEGKEEKLFKKAKAYREFAFPTWGEMK